MNCCVFGGVRGELLGGAERQERQVRRGECLRYICCCKFSARSIPERALPAELRACETGPKRPFGACRNSRRPRFSWRSLRASPAAPVAYVSISSTGASKEPRPSQIMTRVHIPRQQLG